MTDLCKECGLTFNTSPSRKRVGKGLFCSRLCYFRHWGKQRPDLTKICKRCGKEFQPYRRSYKQQVFCSRQCQLLRNYRFPGGARRYPSVFRPDCCELHRGIEQRAEHIIKAEHVLGRRLKKNECVHHINGNHQDNRNFNLLICTKNYHSWLHWEMSRRYMQEHFGGHNGI